MVFPLIMPGMELLDYCHITLPPAESDTARSSCLTELESSLQLRFANLLAHPGGQALLAQLQRCSPFLSGLVQRQPEWFLTLCEQGITALETLAPESLPDDTPEATLRRALRHHKQRVALAAGIAECTRALPQATIMRALSRCAETALDAALAFAMRHAPGLELPESGGHGVTILGMGKLGAEELNFSSDIDIILLYDPQRLVYTGRHSLSHCLVQVTRKLVDILEQRDGDGYVFRTDLRLRPDPGSTPAAVSVDAAIRYYESVGKNWERAAFIKARPVAGDRDAGAWFLKQIRPFIWRKYLDFAAIEDIHMVKRQYAQPIGQELHLPGYHVKLGAGGIREIELFVQAQQLIWGGKQPALQTRATLDTVAALVSAGHLAPTVQHELQESYLFLRRVEHHLQMVADQQTHRLPEQKPALDSLARFMLHTNRQELLAELEYHLRRVNRHTLALFQDDTETPRPLVEAIVHDAAQAAELLQAMGFHSGENAVRITADWLAGKRRATRHPRVQRLLTELLPELLSSFSRAMHPDDALAKCDDFLNHLPSGVQLFSLLHARPALMQLLATVLGSAPALAEALARWPHRFDQVLQADFYTALPERTALQARLVLQLEQTADMEERLEACRRFRHDMAFRAGIHLLDQLSPPEAILPFLSEVADLCIRQTLEDLQTHFTEQHGILAEGKFAILAVGKLGSRELSFDSDLDLIFVYAAPEDAQAEISAYLPNVYYARLSQRMAGALEALGNEGRLYQVDTRLRPMGKDGPLAASLPAFARYLAEDAWGFEYLALTRARVIAGDEALVEPLRHIITEALLTSRARQGLAQDIAMLREKIREAYPVRHVWELKHHPGGLLDLELLAQACVLKQQNPTLHHLPLPETLAALSGAGLPESTANQLAEVARFYRHLQAWMRLCLPKQADPTLQDANVRAGMMRHFGVESLEMLEKTLQEAYITVSNALETYLKTEETP